MPQDARPLSAPDGIDPTHAEGRGAGLNWISLAVLSVLMLAALLGVFGGGKVRPVTVDGNAAQLIVATPRVIRNGEFFETRIQVTARQPIGKAVIAIPASLWRDMTINTMIPAPGEEKAEKGAFRFDYGAMKPGDVLDIKIDGQINPPLFAGTSGTIILHDGERPIAEIPLSITVLP